MEVKNIKFLILGVSIIFFADDANAIMDGFLNGFSSFNNVAQGVNKFVKSGTGQAIFKVVDSAGKLAKNSVEKKRNKKEEDKRRSKYFKETDYYINKEGTLCVFRNGEVMPLGGKKMNLNSFLENNIYVLGGKNYIYTTKDAIEPTVGHFEPVVFEQGKLYYVNGRLYQFVNNKLQLYDVAMENVSVELLTPEAQDNNIQETNAFINSMPITSTSTIPSTSTNIIQNAQTEMAAVPPVQISAQELPAHTSKQSDINNIANNKVINKNIASRLTIIKKILHDEINYINRTGILNLGKLNFNAINDMEYKLITDTILKLKKTNPTLIKSIIMFTTNINTAKFLKTFQVFCNNNNIQLRVIRRKKIQDYIIKKFSTKNITDTIALTECDINDLTCNEVLFLRCCAIENIIKRLKDNTITNKKLLLNIKAVKSSDIQPTNIKIIKALATTYKNFITINIINSLDAVTIP